MAPKVPFLDKFRKNCIFEAILGKNWLILRNFSANIGGGGQESLSLPGTQWGAPPRGYISFNLPSRGNLNYEMFRRSEKILRGAINVKPPNFRSQKNFPRRGRGSAAKKYNPCPPSSGLGEGGVIQFRSPRGGNS